MTIWLVVSHLRHCSIIENYRGAENHYMTNYDMHHLYSVSWAMYAFSLLTFAVIAPAYSDESSVDYLKASRVLVDVAGRWQDNFQHMQTWSGELHLDFSTRTGSRIESDTEGEIDFAFDAKTGNVRSTWLSGLNRSGVAPQKFSEMEVGGRSYRYSDMSGKPVLLINPLGVHGQGVYNRSFVPASAFSPGGMDIYGHLKFLAGLGEAVGQCITAINTVDQVLTIIEESTYGRATYSFDISKDYALVAYSSESKDLESYKIEWRWEYEHLNGVWTPTLIYHDSDVNTPEGRSRQIRTITIKKQQVNTPLSSDAFSIERLGVGVGDLVNDKILGMTYTYSGDPLLTKISDLLDNGDLSSTSVINESSFPHSRPESLSSSGALPGVSSTSKGVAGNYTVYMLACGVLIVAVSLIHIARRRHEKV